MGMVPEPPVAVVVGVALEVLVVVVVVEALVVVVTAFVEVFEVVVEVATAPVLIETLYEETERTALLPVNGSVPAPSPVIYWLAENPWLLIR
jgi:hypothetical protein